ncbi:hypothetical protein [Aliiroseovarius sp. YM-037]|uniref:hypothetical protein n=1 Tax=Aliiroseovarius sp. YM-037 TaxID=3341728 RepID=UPI003A809817
MSAPKTDLDKQEVEHKPAINGIKLSLIIVALLFIGYLIYIAAAADDPAEGGVRIDTNAEQITTTE